MLTTAGGRQAPCRRASGPTRSSFSSRAAAAEVRSAGVGTCAHSILSSAAAAAAAGRCEGCAIPCFLGACTPIGAAPVTHRGAVHGIRDTDGRRSLFTAARCQSALLPTGPVARKASMQARFQEKYIGGGLRAPSQPRPWGHRGAGPLLLLRGACVADPEIRCNTMRNTSRVFPLFFLPLASLPHKPREATNLTFLPLSLCLFLLSPSHPQSHDPLSDVLFPNTGLGLGGEFWQQGSSLLLLRIFVRLFPTTRKTKTTKCTIASSPVHPPPSTFQPRQRARLFRPPGRLPCPTAL